MRVDPAQIISTRAVEIVGAGAAKAEDQFFRDAFNQTDADRQRMIDAANVLFGQMPNEVAQAALIDGAQLFQQDDRGQLQAVLGVDVVVGGKSLAFTPVLLVMEAIMTVGLCLFPTLF